MKCKKVKVQEMGEERRRGSQTLVFLFSAPFPGARPQTSGWVWIPHIGHWALGSLPCTAQEGSQLGSSDKLQKAQLSLHFR